ncbi:hypothetical protein J7K07_06060 [Candidatus Bathyarchaeota archaeon]|nr:hypothetical protein [Candidatus Bathyarchaeota archaeon]
MKAPILLGNAWGRYLRRALQGLSFKVGAPVTERAYRKYMEHSVRTKGRRSENI